MRFPLATTLRNRTDNTDKDPRLLNCVVDSKKRVLKRPSTVATYEVATPGAGLGLYVRTTPGAPGVPGTEELIQIVGSILTQGATAYFQETHTLIAGTFTAGSGVIEIGQGTTDSVFGSISPTTLNGRTIKDFITAHRDFDLPNFVQLNITGALSQSFFTSVTANGITLTSATADTFLPGGATTTWIWTTGAPNMFPSVGTYQVKFA